LTGQAEMIRLSYDPQKKVALVVDEWAQLRTKFSRRSRLRYAWYAPLPGSNPGSWFSKTACCRYSGRMAAVAAQKR